MKCFRNGKSVNCDPPFNGTKVKTTCLNSVNADSNQTNYYYMDCINGKWKVDRGYCLGSRPAAVHW